MRTFRTLSLVIASLAFVTSCASNTPDSIPAAAAESAGDATSDVVLGAARIRLVSADEALDISSGASDELIVLDVRTTEEFDQGHIEGAIMIDFYGTDFAERLAELDPGRPYLLYCRSGNRSGQTVQLMRQLGFTDVADVDGGIVALAEAGHPLVTG